MEKMSKKNKKRKNIKKYGKKIEINVKKCKTKLWKNANKLLKTYFTYSSICMRDTQKEINGNLHIDFSKPKREKYINNLEGIKNEK